MAKQTTYQMKYNKKMRSFSSKVSFINKLASLKWDKTPKVYIKVSYGFHKDNRGKMQEFYNDGVYTNKHDLSLARRAFMEDT